VKLLVQPDDGLAPILGVIKAARKSIDVTIFRFDRSAIEKALAAAVARGVMVRALIAHTNAGGEKRLRKLELRLLSDGILVSRTDDDLLRYHDKIMIVDGKTFCLMAFNFTRLDIEVSRSFALVTRDRKLVQEARRLFEADLTRQPYKPAYDGLVVSPENARDRIEKLLRCAKQQLLVYDHKLSDPSMIRILFERAKAGVDVRVIGHLAGRDRNLKVERFPGRRLHLRAIMCDGRRAFVGSQSLRREELDSRREVGAIVHNPPTLKRMMATFEEDWSRTKAGQEEAKRAQDEAAKETEEPKGGARDAAVDSPAAS
jgi:cardiolipin synthase